MRNRSLTVTATLIIVMGAASGCSGSDGAGCPAPTPLVGDSELAGAIDADRIGTVTAAQSIPGLATLTIESPDTVGELRDRVPRVMRRIGFDKLSEDNEGFEAEIYFGGADEAAGVASIRENALCPERTTVQLSVTGWTDATG
jgi:hypothetical protein